MSTFSPNNVRVGFVVSNPFAMPCFTGYTDPRKCAKPGYAIEIIMQMCAMMDWNCNYKRYSTWGGNSSGTWNGLIKGLMDDEIDVTYSALSITPERAAVVHFSPSIHAQLPVPFMTRYPVALQYSTFFTIKIFQPLIWITLLLAVVLVGLSLVTFDNITNNIYNNFVGFKSWLTLFIDSIFQNLAILSQQGLDNYKNGMNFSTQMLIGTWILAAFVLASTYAGTFISVMLVKTLQVPFTNTRTLAGCIEEGECVLVTNDMDTSMVQYMLQSKDPGAQVLQTAFTKTPIELVTPTSALFTKIIEDKTKYFVYPITDSYFEALTSVHDRCSYFRAGILLTVNLAFGINPKKAHYVLTEKFNNSINQLHAAHFVEGTMGRYLYKPADCTKERNPDNEKQKLGLSSMLGVFVILFIGISTALLALLYEFCIKAVKKSPTTVAIQKENDEVDKNKARPIHVKKTFSTFV